MFPNSNTEIKLERKKLSQVISPIWKILSLILYIGNFDSILNVIFLIDDGLVDENLLIDYNFFDLVVEVVVVDNIDLDVDNYESWIGQTYLQRNYYNENLAVE